MWAIRYKNGPSEKESVGTREGRKVEPMQLVGLSLSKGHIGADDSVPWRRGRVAQVASSTIDVEATSTEDEGDLAAA